MRIKRQTYDRGENKAIKRAPLTAATFECCYGGLGVVLVCAGGPQFQSLYSPAVSLPSSSTSWPAARSSGPTFPFVRPSPRVLRVRRRFRARTATRTRRARCSSGRFATRSSNSCCERRVLSCSSSTLLRRLWWLCYLPGPTVWRFNRGGHRLGQAEEIGLPLVPCCPSRHLWRSYVLPWPVALKCVECRWSWRGQVLHSSFQPISGRREDEMSARANERVAWFNGEFMPEQEVRIPFRDFQLGLWRRLLRHDPQLRPSAVQGEGAR